MVRMGMAAVRGAESKIDEPMPLNPKMSLRDDACNAENMHGEALRAA